jgi:hypothetical protein
MNDIETREVEKRDKDFSAWRKTESDKIPALAARIFALRGKMYMGRGFHWSMEKKLGGVNLT